MIGRLFDRRREPCLSLELSNVWEIDAPADVAAFMRSLPQILPAQAGLVLENAVFADDIAALVQQHGISRHPRVAQGTILPRSRQVYLSLSVCVPLAKMLEHHPVRSVCDHLHAFTADRVLLEWWDASCGDPWHLSGVFPEEQVRSFCQPLGCKYEWLGT